MFAALSFGAVIVGLGLLSFGLISAGTFDVIFAIAMGNTALALMERIGIRRETALVVAASMVIISLGLQLLFPSIKLTPYLAVIIINAFVAWVFGRALVAGRTPLIVQLIRITGSGPEGPPDFQRYVYGQCWVWTVFGAGTAFLGLIAMLLSGTRGWIDPAITTLLLVQVAWFVLAHLWARLRHKRPETAMQTLRVMSHPATWSKLEL